MLKKSFYVSVCMLIIFTFILSACNFPLTQTTQTATPAPIKTEDQATVQSPLNAADIYSSRFADYSETSVSLPDSFSGGYTLPLDLASVKNLADFALTESQQKALSQNGFVVTPPSSAPNQIYTEFYQAYESLRYETTPVFVTTDSMFHIYHLVFDKMLRDLERTSFIPTLKTLTSALVKITTEQYNSLKGSKLEDAALRNVAYFTIAAQLLGTGDAVLPEAKTYVDAELALINAGAGTNPSPLWANSDAAADMQMIEDYSQYIPRGHYTRSEDLKAYFKAMMWYGRLSFRLKDSLETERALLITQALRTTTTADGQSALTLWQNIYEPTVFIVGKADDLGVAEYGKIIDFVYGENPDLGKFADQDLLAKFVATARQLPAPQVNSMWVWIWQDRDEVTQGFRFMGQRFTLDEYVFGQLMWRNVGTLDEPRDLPKALDFFAAQGSDTAYSILKDMGEPKYENYDKQMTKVKDEVSKLGTDSWTQNLYWSWLYALQPVFAEKGKQYPAFMQTDAWNKKDLQTALSSWTELKHDTILYSKQVMAEMGGGAPEEAPQGYVEPNPEAYARLLALAQMTEKGLDSRGILDDTSRGNLDNLIEKLTFLQGIAEKELNSGDISQDDFWQIQYYGGWLESMTVAAADTEDQSGGDLNDQKSPVVADVATGMGRVLEEGLGYPTLMYVVMPDSPYQVAVGVVYTYYEFTVSPDARMTDEAWRQQLETNPIAQPEWTSSFIVP
ncbi:MAG: DUF3160 domain-containing protein [Anaerolineaceae bacterium]|nr:DUF3160 domain-containing protein [Anaerolineaceae bacterium]